eukprot:INCI14376.2.p1 GENE.INCI14376.2~~INCI14376.2.p1  ORF type:complete len:231 (-),score=40.78 INCI14376.2:75-767(-)
MELPYGFESRHNTADPTAVVFSKKVVAREVTQEVRDEAVRQKYLSMSLPVASKDTGSTGSQTSSGGGDKGNGSSSNDSEVTLPIGWASRTAASAELTSPAAVEVNWSTLVVPKAMDGSGSDNRTIARNEVSASGNPGNDRQAGGIAESGGVTGSTAASAANRTTPESTSSAEATWFERPANDHQSGRGKERTEMAKVVLRLHQIEQEAATLVAERQALLQKLSMMIATSS